MVKKHIDEGVPRKRCGFITDSKLPVREGYELFTEAGEKVGIVTSGCPSPSLKQSIGMAHVDVPHNKFKTKLIADVRGKKVEVTVKKMPFVPTNYYKAQ